MPSVRKELTEQLCSGAMFNRWALTAKHRALRLVCRALVLNFAVLGFALCVLQLPALAQTGPYTWTDADYKTPSNQFWSDATNWNDPNGNPSTIVPGVGCTSCSATIPLVNIQGYTTFPVQNISATLANLSVTSGTKVQMKDVDLTITSGLTGDVEMNNDASGLTRLFINAALIYTQGLNGIQMEYNSQILGNGTLENEGTISYGGKTTTQGQIGDGALTLKNITGFNVTSGGQGGSNSVLNLCPNANWTNDGTISAQNGAVLNINCTGTITQTGAGQISAANATVYLGGSGGSPTIVGGTLATPNTGVIGAGTGGASTLSNLTIAGAYQVVLPGSSTTLVGTITNNGSISISNSTAGLLINSPVILGGTGYVALAGSSGSNANISGSGTLTNQQLIQGYDGTIAVGTLANEGTIKASAFTLTIQPGSGGVRNTGEITATGGTVVISGGTVNNTSGLIDAGSTGFARLTGDVTVVGGTIGTKGGNYYVEGTSATLDGTSSPVTLAGEFAVLSGDQTTIKGTITGSGNITVAGCPTPAVLQTKGTTTIDAAGIVLGNDCPQNSFTGDGSTVTIGAGSSLSGNGTVYRMKLMIDPKATITAGPDAGTPLIFDITVPLNNKGTDTIDTGVTEIIKNLTNLRTGTISGGAFGVAGTLQVPGDIQTNNAIWKLMYPGQVTDPSNNNAFGGWNTNGTKGNVFIGPNFFQSTTPPILPFSNQGKIGLGAGGGFTVNGGGAPQTRVEDNTHSTSRVTDSGLTIAYNQTGSTAVTSVDGELTVPSGDLINFAGGTVEGAGTFNGSVQVGNPTGGAVATFIVGDDTKHAGAITVTQTYTQLATGVMDVQIGGTNPGSQYSQLNATGAVTLSGTLNIKLINRFKPSLGQTFLILNAPSGITGTFATVNGLSINANEHFAVTYNSTSVVLTVTAGP